jgi:hypothetical protein
MGEPSSPLYVWHRLDVLSLEHAGMPFRLVSLALLAAFILSVGDIERYWRYGVGFPSKRKSQLTAAEAF